MEGNAHPLKFYICRIMSFLYRVRAMARGFAACAWLAWPGLLVAAVPTANDYGLADQSVDVWETAQGLPQNTVTAIAQTRDGYLWLGTQGGLACFDGSRFQTFTDFGNAEFPSSRITTLCADRDGGLWIGTAEGGASYLFRGKFQSFTTRDGLADNEVLSLGIGADGSVWIGTARGVSIWRGGKMERLAAGSGPLSGPMTAICDGGEGARWMLGQAGVISSTESGQAKTPSALAGTVAGDPWQGLVPGQGGNLWLFGNGLVRLAMDGRSAAMEGVELTPGDAITAVCERSDGEVWFGTRFGQLRRAGNGSEPLPPTKSLPLVRCLFEDRELNLWLGLDGGGLARVKPKRVGTYGVRDGLPGDRITGICPDGKRGLWVGCHADGIAHWSEGKFVPFTANGALPTGCIVWSLLRSKDGSLWIGTEGAGLLRWKDERFERFGPEQGMTQSAVRALVESGDGSLWIGGRDEGLIRRNAEGFAKIGETKGFDGKDITVMTDDGDGGLWIGTDGSGLYRFSGGKSARFARADGLGSDHIRALRLDASGVLWIGTSGGLTQLKDRAFRNLSSRDGLWSDAISQILEDSLEPEYEDQRLWLGSNHGIFRIRKGVIEDYFHGKITSLEVVGYGRAEGMDCLECSGGFSPAGMRQSSAENPGTAGESMWFPTLRGLARLDVLRLIGKPQGISGDHIAFAKAWLHLGPDDTHFDLGDVVAGGNGFGTGRAPGIEARDGKLRQRSETYGRFDPAKDAAARYHRSDVPFVDGVFIPDGSKVAGKQAVISSTGLKAEFPATTGEAWGLLKSGLNPAGYDVFNPSEMKQLGAPMVWLSGNQGITFDLDAIRKATGKAIDRFTAEACNLHVGPASFQVLLDGRVAARRSGMVHDNDRFERGIVPLDIPVPADVRFLTLAATDDKDEIGLFNRVPPTIVVEEVRADGALLSPAETGGSGALHPDFSALAIPPGAGRLDFRYAAPSLAAPEKVRFRYRLEPLEKTWIDAGDRRTVNYANLDPGDYRFFVTASNNDGVWNELGTSVALTLRPHFWQALWFTPLWVATLVFSIASATGFTVRARNRRQIRHLEQLQALAAERTRIARDLHDDLGAGLTQVVLLSDRARGESAGPDRGLPHLDQVSSVSRRLARSLDEIVWAINPKNDALEDSLSFVCKSAQDFLRTAGIACRLDWPEELSAGRLSSARRHQLYLAVREVLNNVVKHAQATEVKMRLAATRSDLIVEIHDNGCGFTVPDRGAPTARHGLDGMAGRMAAVGGGVEITSEPGHGATVRLRLPIDERA